MFGRMPQRVIAYPQRPVLQCGHVRGHNTWMLLGFCDSFTISSAAKPELFPEQPMRAGRVFRHGSGLN
ncbi:MAG: hypothetical protein GY849_22385 [Deltaproteobacteria bacterium]|nr:hypothetical protein [Deltaproteobacteria bacterium]